MASRDPHLAAILDGLLGRGPVVPGAHEGAERLLAAGRRALASAPPGRRAMARAMRIFREATKPRASLLRLVLDSLLAPAPALRASAATGRFLRFEGAVTVELQLAPAARGIDLRGQLTPAGYAAEVVVAGKRRRRARVAPDGSFVMRGVPRGTVTLEVGPSRFAGLTL